MTQQGTDSLLGLWSRLEDRKAQRQGQQGTTQQGKTQEGQQGTAPQRGSGFGIVQTPSKAGTQVQEGAGPTEKETQLSKISEEEKNSQVSETGKIISARKAQDQEAVPLEESEAQEGTVEEELRQEVRRLRQEVRKLQEEVEAEIEEADEARCFYMARIEELEAQASAPRKAWVTVVVVAAEPRVEAFGSLPAAIAGCRSPLSGLAGQLVQQEGRGWVFEVGV